MLCKLFAIRAAFLLVAAITLFATCDATISDTFRIFLRNTYGVPTERLLARDDLGTVGAIGGGNLAPGFKTRRPPIVYVHGVNQVAGDLTLVRFYFMLRGYTDEEFFASTYGDWGRRTKFLVDPMKCDYVKQVRTMIIAVAAYTNSQVDVVGFSMGSPVSRKAILGGACVDTGEDLGPPLTSTVRTFLGLAGANQGTLFCLPANYPECNAVNGLSCGSRYLADINSKRHYEGQRVYSFISRADEVVGYELCGQVASAVPGADREHVVNGYNHYEMLFHTAHLQYNIILNGTL